MRKMLSFLAIAVLFLASFVSVCIHSQILLPSQSEPNMAVHHHADTATTEQNCANCSTKEADKSPHMQILSVVVPGSLTDSQVLFVLAFVALAFVVVKKLIIFELSPDARLYIRNGIYRFRIPALVYAFQRGILHPKIYA